MKKIKRFKPIRIHSIDFGYGRWFGKYFFFLHPFAIIPMHSHYFRCTYEDGKRICAGCTSSFEKM